MKKVIKEGLANRKIRFETIGGKLFLYEDNLVFKSHSINIQEGDIIIELSTIKHIVKKWNKLFWLVPIIPNKLQISLNNGRIYNFIVWEINDWIKELTKWK